MSRVVACLGLSLCLLGCGVPEASAPPAQTKTVPASRDGQELVGQPAPAFAADMQWLSGEALTLEDLRGKVVLVRFWTDTCPFCQASAPGLAKLHERYGPEGLVVIGLFHPKPRGSVREMEAVRTRARELGMTFPIASDTRWDTLERWWLSAGKGERAATSASLLLDAEGIIRWVHPGPELHPDGPCVVDANPCHADYADAVAAIEALLAERGPTATKAG